MTKASIAEPSNMYVRCPFKAYKNFIWKLFVGLFGYCRIKILTSKVSIRFRVIFSNSRLPWGYPCILKSSQHFIFVLNDSENFDELISPKIPYMLF